MPGSLRFAPLAVRGMPHMLDSLAHGSLPVVVVAVVMMIMIFLSKTAAAIV